MDNDPKLALALVRLLEIVGEALSAVTQDTRAIHTAVPWREAVSMRNRLIHGYADVNLDVVWETVTTKLPELRQRLLTILADG